MRTSHGNNILLMLQGKFINHLEYIYKSSFCLPDTSLCTFYYNSVYPYLVYCVLVWASTYPTNVNRIVILQKKIVRFISKKPIDTHTEPIFNDLQILKFSIIYLFQIGKFMYSFRGSLLPRVFKNMFSLTSSFLQY